jgi:hypothetical protein
MSGVYKKLSTSDIRVTPFKVYKKYAGTGLTGSAYTYYEGVYSKNIKNLGSTEILSSDYTANNKLKQAVHYSTNHLFYRDFIENNKGTFGPGNINNQTRILYDQVGVISIPQQNFGEGVMPGSIKLYISHSNSLLPTNPTYFIDDTYGNLVYSGSISYQLSQSYQCTRLRTEAGLPYLNTTASFEFKDILSSIPTTAKATNIVAETSSFGISFGFTGGNSSSLIIKPVGEDLSERLNFTDQDFSIGFWLYVPSTATDGVILEKRDAFETKGINQQGKQVRYPVARYPYKFQYSGGSVVFSKSSGPITITTSVAITTNRWEYIVLSRIGSEIKMRSTTTSTWTSLTDTILDELCANVGNIYVGRTSDNTQLLNFKLDQFHIWNTGLSSNNYTFLSQNSGSNDLSIGNTFYKQGLITLTDKSVLLSTGSQKPISCEYRATTTIYETEVSCTVKPGEYQFSNNPTLQVYDPTAKQFKLKGFATESVFRPYVTQLGLYDDQNQLVVACKLSQPIQLSSKTDTTFLIKYDK